MTNSLENFYQLEQCNKQKRIPIKNSSINQYFAHIYVINLKRRPDRFTFLLTKLKELGIEFQIFNAVDGSKNPYYQEYLKYSQQPLNKNNPMEVKRGEKIISSPGAWGYLHTWKLMVMDAQKNNYQNFLSLDDDVIFHKNFNQELQKLISQIPIPGKKGWKVLNLGATQLPKFRPEIPNNRFYYHPKICDGSFATAIDQSIFSELLLEIEKFQAPLDSGPLRTLYQRYPSLCYVAWPNLIIADVSDSDIRESKKMNQLAERLEWDLTQYQTSESIQSFIIYINPYLKLYNNNIKKFYDGLIKWTQQPKKGNFEIVEIIDGFEGLGSGKGSRAPIQLKELLDKYHKMIKNLSSNNTYIYVQTLYQPQKVGFKNCIEIAKKKIKGKYCGSYQLSSDNIQKINFNDIYGF